MDTYKKTAGRSKRSSGGPVGSTAKQAARAARLKSKRVVTGKKAGTGAAGTKQARSVRKSSSRKKSAAAAAKSSMRAKRRTAAAPRKGRKKTVVKRRKTAVPAYNQAFHEGYNTGFQAGLAQGLLDGEQNLQNPPQV
ncbi:hypothetical protein [Paenibacillus sp. FJAT-26967]|uniref:hypothetical protein n=1 Tax=Paenibacillus sp. FJAT-26967 TaxID=1729690 RepID=UPI000837C1E3|nr:hypothetical protein [Paenibacillus sp. FJAT-26967]